MSDKFLLRGGAFRWAAAIAVLIVGGGLSISHALSTVAHVDDVAKILGDRQSVGQRLFEGPHGLSLRIDGLQRTALKNLLKSDPLAGSAVALAALDRQAQGDVAGAKALSDQALRIEPRTRLAWLARLDNQTRGGNPVGAAVSTIRLLTIDTGGMAVYLPILVSLTRDPRTIPVISKALVGDTSWGPPFVAMLIDGKVDPATRYALMNPDKKKASAAADADRNLFVSNLAGTGDVERAYLAWLSFLPDSALSGVGVPYDATFAGLPGAAPFNWQLTTADSDRASIDGGQLNLSYSGRAPVTLAKQLVLPKPGVYRLKTVVASVENAVPNGGTTFAWTAYCAPSGKMLASFIIDPKVTNRAQQSAPFIVPAADCPAVSLQLDGTASEFPVRLTMSLASVELVPSATPQLNGQAATLAQPSASPAGLP